jgi:hypothetical protein
VATTSVTLSGRFPKGAKAGLSLLAGSVPQPGGASKTTTVGADGVVSFKGLDVGAQYVVEVEGHGQFRVQAKDESFSEDANLHRTGPEATQRRNQADREAQAAAFAEAKKRDPLVGSPAPGRTMVDNRPSKGSGVRRPQPGPRQQDVRGPQRSDTPEGEGTPVQRRPNRRTKQTSRARKTSGSAKRAATKTGK